MQSQQIFARVNGSLAVTYVVGSHGHQRSSSAVWSYNHWLVWFPDPSSGGEREGSGELPAACADPWHFNLMNLAFRTFKIFPISIIQNLVGLRGILSSSTLTAGMQLRIHVIHQTLPSPLH